jgi:LuxR family maltose regulon positive regulatory protein
MDLGHLADADRVLRDLPADAENPLTAVEIALTTALLADRRREDVRARDAIERAVVLAAPQRLCLPFITFDRNRVPRLLSRVVTSDPVQKSFLTEFDRLSFPSGHPTAEPEPLAEQLTDREMGVLRLLPSMLSNNEIADELFISVNTVKVHLKTLYRKLDAPTVGRPFVVGRPCA